LDSVKNGCLGRRAQVVFVDDGSTDKSWAIIENLAQQHADQVQGIRFRRNMGKALALEAGFRLAQGDVIFTMDADLQAYGEK
jgi:glycosyltransferase involved in cell wall biosynthesis